jgi:hypothetical protein
MANLVYQTSPIVTFATNTFVNVPTILQYEDTPLVSVVKEQALGFTSEIPIYHSDGTYLAKVKGTRMYGTKEAKAAGLRMRDLPGQTVCELNGRPAFEIQHQPGDAFRIQAELYAPDGYLVKYDDDPMGILLNRAGKGLHLRGVTMSNNHFHDLRIGVWVKCDGTVFIAVG